MRRARQIAAVVLAVGGLGWLVASAESDARVVALGMVGAGLLLGNSRSPPNRGQQIAAALARAHHAMVEGYPDEAVGVVLHLHQLLPRETCPFLCVNYCIEVLVNAGRYLEALDLPHSWSTRAREQGKREDLQQWALVEINLAEAEYNLGRTDAAWRRMCKLEQVECDAQLIRNGLLVQKAWIAALEGRGRDALQLIEPVELELMPKAYRAEVLYTRAFAHSVLGEHAAARAEGQAGLELTERASSHRNGLFLLGTLAHRAGELELAAEHFSSGAEHRYCGQGGDALLTWGDTLRGLGRRRRAEHAYRLVLVRDPQSAAAKSARQRIRELGRDRPRSEQ